MNPGNICSWALTWARTGMFNTPAFALTHPLHPPESLRSSFRACSVVRPRRAALPGGPSLGLYICTCTLNLLPDCHPDTTIWFYDCHCHTLIEMYVCFPHQGRTSRWAIAWSFEVDRNLANVPLPRPARVSGAVGTGPGAVTPAERGISFSVKVGVRVGVITFQVQKSSASPRGISFSW
jgi:hypothetical protein